MKKIDLKNKRFGRLIVINEAGRNDFNHLIWLCECDCGKKVEVLGDSLRRGKTNSCGCLAEDELKKRSTTHGDSNKRLYRIWFGIKTRIYNKNRREYSDYGGRGIKLCEEWHEYLMFKDWALENGYSDELSIDRIDVNGNYEPSNCRWATQKEQVNNQRSNNMISCDGITMTLSQWSEKTGIPRTTIYSRIFKYKMEPKKALGL